MIRVLVVGAAGRMGSTVCRTVLDDPELALVGAVDVVSVHEDIGEMLGGNKLGLAISQHLDQSLVSLRPDVVVDFTHPSVVMDSIRTCLARGVDMVVGTTGITQEDLQEVNSLLESSDSNILIAPNFAVGAVLMMKFAESAAKHFSSVEIIELHHSRKADAPSGTALKTAELIAANNKDIEKGQSKEMVKGARGAEYEGVPIHSIRLQGLVAHQEVIFGGPGQTLTIRHDTLDRSSFMPGVLMGIKTISQRKGLTYGLDKLLE